MVRNAYAHFPFMVNSTLKPSHILAMLLSMSDTTLNLRQKRSTAHIAPTMAAMTHHIPGSCSMSLMSRPMA